MVKGGSPSAARQRRRSQAERSAETKARLMDAAVKLLAEKGYSRLTIQDVAQAIGVSRGAPVHHYPNRAALISAIADYSCELAEGLIERGAQACGSSGDPLGDLVNALAEFFLGPIFVAHLEILSAARADSHMGPSLRRRILRPRTKRDKLYVEALSRSGYS